ncbi:endo alpha-1,4 polygalactosaminidase [Amycolatopsis sp. NPDC021455]|uniref:endo alpha-1,4 polygalactosaminidase n=1 Tax=Amycolatopsis sp. NPDC021455 TaxID=3154901 RepID=UPI0033C99D61
MFRPRAWLVAVAVLCGACSAAEPAAPPAPEPARPAAVTPPPAKAAFDYQLGGAYPPAAGVQVVSRDHAAPPAPGLYNICYVNAFQAQPGAESEWGDLVLRDANGELVIDEEWHEALLDLRTPAKRERVAAKAGGWIDDCAAKGYRAIEPDNYDSYTRSHGLLTAEDAQAFVRLLSTHAHEKGLAIAQKNTAELAGRREANGLDFAVVEECGEQDNCGEYTAAFGDHVIVIEYTDAGLADACDRWGGSVSIVRRDRDVVPAGAPGHVRETC